MGQKNESISRREFLKVAGAGLAGVGLASCAPGTIPTQPPAGTSVASAPTVRSKADSIRVLVVGDPFQFALEKVAADFTAETGIDVNLESLSYDALNARLRTSFVSGSPDADVVTVDQMWTGQYYDNKWITPLDDYIKSDPDTNFGDFVPEVIYSLNTWRGHVVTLPIAAYAQGVMYRTDVFEEAGLDAPPSDPDDAGDWTWDRYADILGELHGMQVGDTELFGTVICGAQPVPVVHMYTQLAASHGVRWFESFPESPWNFEPTINSPENVGSLKAYKSLYDLSPPESINYVWFDAGTRFSKGDIGMFYWWTPYFYLVKNDGYMSGEISVVADKYAVGALPQSPDHPQVISLGGWSLGIPSTTPNQDEAWQFIKWATSADTQKKMGLVPDYNYQFSDFPRLSLYEDAELREIYPYLDTQLKLMRQGNGKIVRPSMPIYTTLEGIYGLRINEVLTGSISPEEGLKEAETLFGNVLEGNLLLPFQGDSYNDTLKNTIELMDSLAS